MKRISYLLTVLVFALATSCGDNAGKGRYYTAAVAAGNDDVVYVTRYGKRYHRENCSTIRGHITKRAVSRSEAIGMGKTPCRKCKP